MDFIQIDQVNIEYLCHFNLKADFRTIKHDGRLKCYHEWRSSAIYGPTEEKDLLRVLETSTDDVPI